MEVFIGGKSLGTSVLEFTHSTLAAAIMNVLLRG